MPTHTPPCPEALWESLRLLPGMPSPSSCHRVPDSLGPCCEVGVQANPLESGPLAKQRFYFLTKEVRQRGAQPLTTWLDLYHYAEVITSIQARSPLRRPCAQVEPGTAMWGVDMDFSSHSREPC